MSISKLVTNAENDQYSDRDTETGHHAEADNEYDK
jgi:hypothetical protein